MDHYQPPYIVLVLRHGFKGKPSWTPVSIIGKLLPAASFWREHGENKEGRRHSTTAPTSDAECHMSSNCKFGKFTSVGLYSISLQLYLMTVIVITLKTAPS